MVPEWPVILTETSTYWPDPDTGPWHVALTWTSLNGRAECIGVSLRHGVRPTGRAFGTGPAPVLASGVRGIPLGGIIESARPEAVVQLRDELDGLASLRAHMRSIEMRRESPEATAAADHRHKQYIEQARAAMESLARPRTGVGRKPELGPEHFANVARIYIDAWVRGESPTKAVMDHFHISKSAAAKRVARCRELGLIAKTTPGRSSGSGEPAPQREKGDTT